MAAALVWMVAAMAVRGDETVRLEPTEFGDGDHDVGYEADVRPILVRNCLTCHGFDPSSREADLRLDTFEHATGVRSRGRAAAIIPGNADDSLVMHRVRAADPHDRMPPEGPALTESEVEVLRRWIDDGAIYEPHWSRQPVGNADPPQVRELSDPDWAGRPIDAFILRAMDDVGLRPAAPADRRVLIRRLFFDLHGLPPTPQQVDTFVNDDRPDAIERLVDDLLASPHFGERWARHWLDLMRYAETYGHEFDYPIPQAHEYRDYVIRAFNADVPYDDFVTEHIAGDLVDTPRKHPTEEFNESLIGTGFWWLTQGTHAPTDVRLDEAIRIDNQIDVMSRTFLATTVSCARCHDHKFEPVLQSEYYGIAGYLQSSRRDHGYLDPGARIDSAAASLRRHDTLLRAELSRVILPMLGDAIDALDIDDLVPPEPVDPADPLVAIVERLDDVPALRTWAREQTAASEAWHRDHPPLANVNDPFADWRFTGWGFDPEASGPGVWNAPHTQTEFRPAPTLDSSERSPAFFGTARSPTFAITHPWLFIRSSGKGTVRLIIDGYHLDESNALLFENVLHRIDRESAGWSVHKLGAYVGHCAYLEIVDADATRGIQVGAMHWSDDPTPPTDATMHLTDVYASIAMLEDECTSNDVVEALSRVARAQLSGTPSPLGASVLNALLRNTVLPAMSGDDLQTIKEIRTAMRAETESAPPPRRVLLTTDGSPEDEYVFLRGDHRQRGPTASRGFLSAFLPDIPPPSDTGSGRDQLAEMILDEHNPLTARVMVNRIWQHLMGRGLVDTPDDFGLLGTTPTHPELLDYLARRFSDESAWSVKKVIREIVLSNTYQMRSGSLSDRAISVDPTNRLRSVRAPRRLDGESLRDAMLAVSGRLDRTMFGPPVPVHLTPFMDGRGRPRNSGPVDGDGRRSIYQAVRRNFLNPMLQAFDTPDPHSTMGKRSESNVPAQALVLLNDEFVAQQAELLARDVSDTREAPDARIELIYRRAFGRAPAQMELQSGLAFVENHPGVESDPIQPWADYCHVILNLKEFSFVE